MERIEQQELPGNDASWYREMIAEQVAAKRSAIVAEPEQQADALVQEGETPDESPTDHEPTAASVETKVDDTPTEDEAVPQLEDSPDVPAETVDAAVDAPEADDTPTEDEAAPQLEDSPDVPTETVDAAVDAAEDAADSAPTIAPVPHIGEEAPLENTSEMVGQLWTARDSDGPFEDWEPDDIDRKVGSKRKFRWPTLIGALAVIALIAAGLIVLPSIAQSRADSYLESIVDPLQDLRAELPDAQNSLAVATDPAADAAALAGLTTQLTTFAAKASAVDAATQADPPSAPPLTSSAPIDAVEPIRQQAEPLGTVAITIQRRIANVVEYRSLMAGFLVLPDLPTVADADTQAELRVDLAAAQAESAAILADLPSDVSLESHTAMARELNERFATWQVDYLEALRTGDAAAAEALIAELENARAELDSALVTPLAQIRRQTDADLIDLAREIDAVTALAAEIS